ncbi:MAG TPA: HAD family hydrolase [Candidatus Atribacteria bacterium]|nr:HAD family hydrolase [Candidatus Atribacteria bacterium]HPT77539.1 HAD family hydrolase [Candidatus Atribacteria bacterium]
MDCKKYAVFIDIDGTLMSGGTIPEANIEAIARVRRQGHKVFINTGRSLACIPGFVLDRVEVDGIVAGIGSYVTLGGKVVHCVTIPDARLIRIAEHFMSTGRHCILEGIEKLYYINFKNSKDRTVIESGSDPAAVLTGARISKATVAGIPSKADIELLEPDFNIFQHEGYFEFGLKGCSKAAGMMILLEKLDIRRECCIAIGDSSNDMDMLRFAGISVAMKDAPEEVKAVCDLVTDSAENAGVAQALKELIINTSKGETL